MLCDVIYMNLLLELEVKFIPPSRFKYWQTKNFNQFEMHLFERERKAAVAKAKQFHLVFKFIFAVFSYLREGDERKGRLLAQST